MEITKKKPVWKNTEKGGLFEHQIEEVLIRGYALSVIFPRIVEKLVLKKTPRLFDPIKPGSPNREIYLSVFPNLQV